MLCYNCNGGDFMDKALVAVSGGSDSLALLAILIEKNEYELVVCHVNYHYRESSTRDENIVVEFCKKNGIKYYILSLESKDQKEGNFEDWARVKRYKFFREIYAKEQCKCLFVGHQKEDVIETYIMQKERGAIVENYGLAYQTRIQDMDVIRPLLSYSKKQLEDYCNDKNIVYGVDETNFDLSYKRNKIRHEIISKMSESEKDSIIKEINELNAQQVLHVKAIKALKDSCLVNRKIIDLEKFNLLNKEEQLEIIYYFLIDNVYKKISIKKSRIEDIIKKINSNKPNIVLAVYDNLTFYKEYKLLVIEKNKEEYSYKIDNGNLEGAGEEFSLSNQGKTLEKVVASEEQFPLYLKNYDGTNKEVNRIFIDKKIPLRCRKSWPMIVDKFGRLLLVVNIKKFYNNLCGLDKKLVEFYVCQNNKDKGE